MPQIPRRALAPLSITATHLCTGAMQNVCRRYGDLPLWDARETAVLFREKLSHRTAIPELHVGRLC
jgi:hypothetical protein